MKNKLLKSFTITLTLTLAAGVILFCQAFSIRLPKGTTVNGTDVGGLTRAAAVGLLRKNVENYLKGEHLRICCGERAYDFDFPEFYYKENFSENIRAVRKKGEYNFPVFYYLNGADEIADMICLSAKTEMNEPKAQFFSYGEPFVYSAGNDGAECDKNKLLNDISASLNGGFSEVHASVNKVKRTLSEGDIRARTALLYSFTTYFDGSNTGRSSNIKLAASKINGTVIPAGGTFSFNERVGRRTAENGFKKAKIIENGKFVDGYGGGVCQVSTTLYNAALLSGLEITEFHPHSLSVSYVAPSRDAMVSGSSCDLKFRNNKEYPVYIRASASYNGVTFSVYGKSDGYKYSCLSEITESIPRPPEKVIEGDEDRVITYGKDGIKSVCYLVAERDGVEVRRKIRSDRYAPVGEIRQVKKDGESAEE